MSPSAVASCTLPMPRPRSAREAALLALCSFCGFIGFPVVFSAGVARTSAIHGAMILAMLPVFTVLGLQFATIFGGSVIIENIFSIPGMGDQALRAISTRDYPVVQGVSLLVASLYLSFNLLADLLAALLDPRLRPAPEST